VHSQQFVLPLRFGKSFQIGKVRELRVLVSLGDFNHRMKIHQLFFNPIPVPRQDVMNRRRPSIDLAADQRQIDLATRIADDELGLLQPDQIGEQPPVDIGGKTHGLVSDSNPRGGSKLFQSVEAGFFSSGKDLLCVASG
jgi:hypothetical protein